MSDIDEVKSRLDIVDFIGKRVALKKAGRNFKGLCPFHGERTPSFMVNPDRQAFHCFGCGKGGSVIDFVMEYEHLDFREALEELAEQAGVVLTKRTAQTPLDKKKDALVEIHHLASEYYQYLLKSHPVGEHARDYLKKRQVSDKIRDTFGLGYSANSWDGVSKFLRKKGYDNDLLVESGLVVASARGGYDRFRGRLMFPIRDHRGQVIAFSGRILNPDAKEAKYINSPETPMYTKGNTLFAIDVTKGAIQKEQMAILMEGEFDVISSYQAGISNVVAIKGTALTENQVRLLKRFAPKIVFALDSDLAGDTASRRGIEIAEKAGLEIHVAAMPFGKDPDDVARSEPGTLKKAIKEAQSIYDYYFSSVTKRHDLSTAYGKKNISDELFPILAKIDNAIIQGHYIHQLGDLLGVSESVIHSGLRKMTQAAGKTPSALTPQTKEPLTHEDKQELMVLSILLQGNTVDLYEDIDEEFPSSAFRSTAIKSIIERLGEYVARGERFFLKDFLDTVPSELQPTIDQAMLLDIATIIENPDICNRTWQQTIRELKKKLLYERIQSLMAKLKNEPNGEASAIESEIAEIAKQLRLLEKLSEV